MEKTKKVIVLTLYVLSGICLILMFLNALNNSVWVDEAFSLQLIEHSYKDMITLTALDVHPPLYYIILKAMISIFSSLLGNKIIISKLVSILPVIILLAYSMIHIRKERGEICSAIFSFCIIAMPQIMGHAIEIRMYTWAMLFVFFSGVYAYKIMQNEKDTKHKYWIWFTLSSILAAYTHYFALVAVGVIYILLFIKLLISNKKEIKYWILSSIGITIAYLPWLIVLIKQMSTISGNYWIEPIKLETIKQYIEFVFVSNRSSRKNFIIGYILFIIYGIAFISSLKNSKNKIVDSIGFCVLFFTVMIGIIVSWIFRPIFVDRYMLVAFGLFWLSFSEWISSKNNKKLVLIVLIVVAVGALNVKYITERENKIAKEFRKLY